jgi:hypothetical protein
VSILTSALLLHPGFDARFQKIKQYRTACKDLVVESSFVKALA